MHQNQPKIISLVPSWTETLIEAGLNVVGRTRFCIHPEERVKNITIVGGTKNLKLDQILLLKPDYVLLDKEENKKEMAEALEKAGIELLVSHVESLQSAADFLELLGNQFKSDQLLEWGSDYRRLVGQKLSREKLVKQTFLKTNCEADFNNMEYVIWKNPYMVIGQKTFISEVLALFDIQLKHTEKYPQILEEELKKAYCFFSTEPYPFEKDFAALIENGFRGALIDGEKISWYGVRNLRFLTN